MCLFSVPLFATYFQLFICQTKEFREKKNNFDRAKCVPKSRYGLERYKQRDVTCHAFFVRAENLKTRKLIVAQIQFFQFK